ncbi:Uncharacterised protein [Salmonella bongori]|nr:Uncharacterised protein [Salmonella bongori]
MADEGDDLRLRHVRLPHELLGYRRVIMPK